MEGDAVDHGVILRCDGMAILNMNSAHLCVSIQLLQDENSRGRNDGFDPEFPCPQLPDNRAFHLRPFQRRLIGTPTTRSMRLVLVSEAKRFSIGVADAPPTLREARSNLGVLRTPTRSLERNVLSIFAQGSIQLAELSGSDWPRSQSFLEIELPYSPPTQKQDATNSRSAIMPRLRRPVSFLRSIRPALQIIARRFQLSEDFRCIRPTQFPARPWIVEICTFGRKSSEFGRHFRSADV